MVVIVPRLSLELTRGERLWPVGEVWSSQSVRVPEGTCREVFTGRRHQAARTLRLAEVLADFPVALLLGA